MKKWLEKILGLTQIREDAAKAIAELEATKQEAKDAIKAAADAKEAEELAKLAPKDRATKAKQPWVGVTETHVNKENLRNGFFELDWNDLFIEQLIKDGYGTDADNPEDIVDRWFRELCAGVVVDGDYAEFGQSITAGSLDGSAINQNK